MPARIAEQKGARFVGDFSGNQETVEAPVRTIDLAAFAQCQTSQDFPEPQ